MNAAGCTPRDPMLDALRSSAAALVLLSHARTMLFRDAADQPGLSAVGKAFFALSGFGHQAVIVFFVLSGLLVTEAMLRSAAAGRWSLGGFAVARLTRLWIVLVPCLAFGAMLDGLGLASVSPGQGYGIPPVGHEPVAPALDPGTAIGNLLFLQTIAVPVFGSNGPLWSLACEAWYYAIAALAFAALKARRHAARALWPAGGALLVLLVLPRPIVALAPVWGCGAAVALLRHRFGGLPLQRRRLTAVVALLITGVVLAVARLPHGPEAPSLDLALGLAVAVVLLAWPHPSAVAPWIASGWVRRCADASYSLYLSHVPVLSLFAARTVGANRLPLGHDALGLLGCALLLAAMTAAALWWGFERHTDRLRAWVMARLSGARPVPTPFAEQAR